MPPPPNSEFETPEQFEALFRRYHAPLCEVVFNLVGSSARAEEIVQDLFFTLWTKRHEIAVRGAMSAYLFTAARNRALTSLRREAVEQRTLLGYGDDEVPGMSERAPSPPEQIELDEDIRSLRRAIASLPDRSQLALTLRWQHQLSNVEVADAMGISVKGVEKLLSIAMRRLRWDLLPGRQLTAPGKTTD